MVSRNLTQGIQIRKLEVITVDDLNVRIRIAITDPAGARHVGRVTFTRFDDGMWAWSAEGDDACGVQLPLGVR